MKTRWMVPGGVFALAVLSGCGGDRSSPSGPSATDAPGALAVPHPHGGLSSASAKANQPPIATIHVKSTVVLAGVQSVELSARAQDPDGDAMTYAWDLGDGSKATGATVQKIYAKPRTYTVVLSVRDSNGATTSASVELVAKGLVGVWKDRDEQYGIQVQQTGKVVKGRTVFPIRDLTGALKGNVFSDRRVTWRTDYFGGAFRDYFDGKLSTDLDTLTGTLGLSDGQFTFTYHVKLVRQPKAP